MTRLPPDAGLADFARSTAGFGCLIDSVTSIRSAAGAQYYAYWSLSSGETAGTVAQRLLESGWLQHARKRSGLAPLLAVPAISDEESAEAPDVGDLQRALAEGRLDAATDVLALLPPSARLFPILVELVTRTLSTRSVELLQRWRDSLDESSVQEILSGRLAADSHEIDLACERLGEALERAFSDGLTAAQRARLLEDLRTQAVPRLMQAGVLREVVDVARPLSRSVNSILLADLIDLLLDMERDLFAAGGDIPGIQDLRLIIVEAWALGDESGDRHRVSRLLDLVGRTLTTGVGPAVFDELVESLRAGWAPFLTDADLPLGLEAIEVLAASQPQSAVALQAFATLILSRIGEHNARRIDAACLETARTLAPEFGLEFTVRLEPPDEYARDSADQIRPLAGTFIAIYSLMEPAARRAAAILRRWYPEVRVETFAEKVASDALRYAAKDADLLVIADKAAAHAATDAIKEARGRRPIQYARGKGTTSLIEAALAGLRVISDGVLSGVT
jgi:hypothetical protein